MAEQTITIKTEFDYRVTEQTVNQSIQVLANQVNLLCGYNASVDDAEQARKNIETIANCIKLMNELS